LTADFQKLWLYLFRVAWGSGQLLPVAIVCNGQS